MKRKIILLALIIFPSLCYSQSDLRKGFIITIEGDTIYGEVFNRSNVKSYKSCIIRINGTKNEYFPNDILGYGIENFRYFNAQVIEGVFVEELLRGELSLFKYESQFLLRTSDERVFVIEEGRKQVGANFVRDKKWKGTLYSLIYDCNPSDYSREELKFSEKFIVDLLSEYHLCKNIDYKVFKEDVKWAEFDYGIIAGYNLSTIKFDVSDGVEFVDNEYTSNDPSIGLLLTFRQPRISNRFFLQLELHYHKSNFYALTLEEGTGFQQYHDSFIELTTLSMPFTLNYSILNGSIPVYIQLGFVYDNNLEANAKIVTEQLVGTTVTTEIDNSPFALPKGQLGFLTGVGSSKSFQHFNLGLSLRYQSLFNYAEAVGITADLKRYSINLTLSR